VNVARRPLQYSLATILLVTGLAACCLAVMRLTPVWGTAALLVSALALLRNALVARSRGPEYVATMGLKLELFLESVAVAMLCLVVAGIGCVVSMTATTFIGMVLLGPRPYAPLALPMIALSGLFCFAATIVPFVYTFWKLTFPVR
jgi:hypothetical protein